MSFGGILSSKYDDYMTVLKGKSDGRDMPRALKSTLAKVSRAALASIMEEDHAELNAFDLPKFVDSRYRRTFAFASRLSKLGLFLCFSK